MAKLIFKLGLILTKLHSFTLWVPGSSIEIVAECWAPYISGGAAPTVAVHPCCSFKKRNYYKIVTFFKTINHALCKTNYMYARFSESGFSLGVKQRIVCTPSNAFSILNHQKYQFHKHSPSNNIVSFWYTLVLILLIIYKKTPVILFTLSDRQGLSQDPGLRI